MMHGQALIDRLGDRLAGLRGRLTPNAEMDKITWFRAGGQAEVLFQPADEEDLAAFLRAVPEEIPLTVVGIGSNLLVRDGGIPGFVIRLSAKGFGEAEQARVIADAKERVKAGELVASPEILAAWAVASAAAKLSERQAVFPASTLAREAGDYAFGRLSHNAISAAIAEAGERGALVPRAFVDRRGAEFAGFTTPEAIATEQNMLRLEAAGRGVAAPLASPLASTAAPGPDTPASGTTSASSAPASNATSA